MSSTTSPSTYTEAWLPGYDGHQFYTRTWTAATPKAVMLYVHGFADHISRYDDVFCRWPKHDVTLFAYDLRGFGRTALDEARRSPDASYGKTNRKQELADVEWWLEHLSKIYHGLPLFLMGYSAGGGLALAFPTRTQPPPSPDTIAKLSGVIAYAPLIQLTHPASQLTRLLATYLGKIMPDKVLHAPMPEERFSRRPEVVEALKRDPLRKPEGTLKGLGDMVNQGEQLLRSDYQHWPKGLPLLIVHGTADEANCPVAAESFYNKLNIKDKKLTLYPGALHDLLHEAGDIPERLVDEYISWIRAHIPEN